MDLPSPVSSGLGTKDLMTGGPTRYALPPPNVKPTTVMRV